MNQTASSSAPNDSEFIISRVLDAPRDLVWKAWTEPERLTQWWGPKGLTVSVAELDLRPGGAFRYSMKTPDGQEMWGKFVYTEVSPTERFAFLVSFTDAQGNPIRHPMSPTWPLEVLSTVTLVEKDGKTTMTMTGVAHNATPEEVETFKGGHAGMQQGWKGTLEQLEAYLAQA